MNDFDIEGLVGSVLRGALGGGRKRNRGALRYLTGGRSSFLNASTLLTVAGVAWGLWESAQASSAASVAAAPAGSGRAPGQTVPPPLPTSTPPVGAAAAPLTVPPPLPASTAGAPVVVPPEVLRVLRLTLAAARADGTLAPRERDAILMRARELGAEALIAAELDSPRPSAEIVAGVTNPQARQDLYTLAFAVARADESLTADERTWLTGLGSQLGLDATTVEKLEQHAASRIAEAAEGAQH